MTHEIIFFAAISLVATFLISWLIDSLYKKFSEELSFPNEIESRSRYRKIILSAGIFFCTFFFIKLPEPQNFYSVVAAIFLLTIAITDFEQQIIFDRILLPFALLGIIATWHLNLSPINHLLAAILGGGLFLPLFILTENGIGGGDVKLLFCLGLWFGMVKLFSIIFFGVIFAGISALLLILFGKVKRKDFFAYGVYFALTAVYFLQI